ncbi:hypothetical protein Tco_1431687 [Tanacetum coccineum]
MAVNTKFLNSLPPEWNKYVANVRLEKNLADVTYDAYKDIRNGGRYARRSSESADNRNVQKESGNGNL